MNNSYKYYKCQKWDTVLGAILIVTLSSLNSGNGDSSTTEKDPLRVLEGIISAVHASVEKG